MVTYAIKELALNALMDVLKPYLNDAKGALENTARDALESIITGRRSIDEWARIAIKGVDKVKDDVAEQKGWQYVGGKLNFTLSPHFSNKVVISFELYYRDSEKEWKKVGAESDMYATNFTVEALEDMRLKGIVSFEVE